MLINYIESQLNIESVDNIKYAGLDIGIKNIASIYIHDNTSKSLIISGKKFIAYNSSFNRLLSVYLKILISLSRFCFFNRL